LCQSVLLVIEEGIRKQVLLKKSGEHPQIPDLSMEPINYWIRVARNYNYVLLTEETPHQLLWQLPHDLQAFVDLKWFTVHFFPKK